MIANEGRVTAFPLAPESGRLRLAIPNKGRMQGPSLGCSTMQACSSRTAPAP